MIRILAALIVAVGFLTTPSFAQGPSTQEIVKALTPKPKFRSLRGISVEGKQKPPSFDLHIPFDFNSAQLKPDAILILRRLGTALKDPRLAGYRFKIAGYTDARGSADFNQKLSNRRAESVGNYLEFQYDIDPTRLTVVGYGKTHLEDPALPDAAINRRVRITNIGKSS